MIIVKEIFMEDMNDFWDKHICYLVDEGIITDNEDIEYFQGNEYRNIIINHMIRNENKHHIAYFEDDGTRIGATSYCTYKMEDGKCFILDFWLFEEFRGKGKGHECFEVLRQYTLRDGASYFEINCDGKENRMRFWHSLGFVDNGTDEYGVKLLILTN